MMRREEEGRRAGRKGNSGELAGRGIGNGFGGRRHGEGQRADFTRAEVGFDKLCLSGFLFSLK